MGIRTVLRYLVGSASAIGDIARNRNAVWVGLVFVISAGFAREYDGEYLLAEPWHLLAPIGASLVTSLILFTMLETSFSTSAGAKSHDPPPLRGYRSFLGLYWMTAPLAWLYAVPVERMLDASGSVRANLALLGIVSLWRVLLMIRVVYVVYRRTVISSFFVVLLFGDLVAMAVFWLTPLPILSIMGGIRLTESEQIIQSVGFMVRFWGLVTLPVWFIGHTVTIKRGARGDESPGRRFLGDFSGGSVSKSLWAIAAMSVAIWFLVLPTTQREQRHRSIAEDSLRSGQIAEAIQYMSDRKQSDFPPHWDPPPRIGYGERSPDLVDVLLLCEADSTSEWVREAYRDKLLFQSKADGWSYYLHAVQVSKLPESKLQDYVAMLRSWSRGPEVAAYHQQEIRTLLESLTREADEPELTENRKKLLKELLDLAPSKQSDEVPFSTPQSCMDRGSPEKLTLILRG